MDMNIKVKEAISQYEVRHYENALAIFKKYEKQSDGISLYYLGLMSLNGNGVKRSPKDAFHFFSNAQSVQSIDATYMLGVMYQEGIYVKKDLYKAFEYYHASFHKEHLESGIKIARYYELGLIDLENPQKALETYVECAKSNHPFALYKIGMAYLHGFGVKKNIVSSHFWLNKALLYGSVDAMNQFRLIGTKCISDNRTLSDIFSIGKELYNQSRFLDSIIYFEIALKEGNSNSLPYLAKIYELGQDVNVSKEKAFHYLYLAAEKDDPEALFSLGKKYEDGDGCPSSYIKAEYYYRKAAEFGHTRAKKEVTLIRGAVDDN